MRLRFLRRLSRMALQELVASKQKLPSKISYMSFGAAARTELPFQSDIQLRNGSESGKTLDARVDTCGIPKSIRYIPYYVGDPFICDYEGLVARLEPEGGVQFNFLYDVKSREVEKQAEVLYGDFIGKTIELSENSGPLLVTVGIEEGLSLLSGLLLNPHRLLAVPSLQLLELVELPDTVGKLVVAVAGTRQARSFAKSLSVKARGLGWKVSLMAAPDGKTWNDVLRERTS